LYDIENKIASKISASTKACCAHSSFPFIILPMFSCYILKSARWTAAAVLLAALPLVASASTIAVDFNFTLNGIDGSGDAVYNPADVAGGSNPYADPNDGLVSFDLSYNGSSYTNTSSNLLDGVTLPTVFLPGNDTLQNGLSYEFFGVWVVSGACTGSVTSGVYNGTCEAGTDILLLGRSTEVALLDDVTSVELANTGNDLAYNFGYAPDITEITGSITSEVASAPEPTLLPFVAFGLAGLWFVRRRKTA
jgi:MYXO-CTERM domain-containing protein